MFVDLTPSSNEVSTTIFNSEGDTFITYDKKYRCLTVSEDKEENEEASVVTFRCSTDDLQRIVDMLNYVIKLNS